MAFHAFSKFMIDGDTIENYTHNGTNLGYEFKLRYPSYRGTFLSCIEKLEIAVDDKPVDSRAVVFILNGKEFLVHELKELFREYWFVLDRATIRVLSDGGLTVGTHTLKVCLKHRIPYTGYFGSYLVLDSICEKTVKVGG